MCAQAFSPPSTILRGNFSDRARCPLLGSREPHRIIFCASRPDRADARCRLGRLSGAASAHSIRFPALSTSRAAMTDACARCMGRAGAALDHLIVRHTRTRTRAQPQRRADARAHPTSHHTRCMHRPSCATCRTRSRSLGFCLAVEMPRVRPACALFKLCAQQPHSLTRRSAHSAGWLVGDACAALCHMTAHAHTCCPLPSRLLVSRPRVSLQCALRA
jgi:hypothetical protein